MPNFAILILSIVRHLSAVVVAWIAMRYFNFTGKELPPEVVAGMIEEVVITVVAVMTAIYASTEKIFKPIFKRFGERE